MTDPVRQLPGMKERVKLTEEKDKGDTKQDQNVRDVHDPGVFQ